MAPTVRRRPSLLTRAAGLCLAAGAVTLGGCNTGQHGQYTSEHKAQAQERMATLKSGTEWQMAHQQFMAGEVDKALRNIDKSLALNPKVAKSHVLKGRCLIEKGRLEEARTEFLEAEKLEEKNVEAQYYLGIVHEQFGQPAEALGRYQKAAELDSANAQYVTAASEMMVQLNQLNEAEAYLTQKQQVFQYNAAIRQSLGHIALLKGEPQNAAQRFSEALLLAPDDAAILEDVAQSQMQCGNYAEAEFAISKLLDRPECKDRRDLKMMKAKCLMSVNRPAEARSLLLDLTEDKEATRDTQVWIDLGNVAAVLKDKLRLRQASARVVALAPDRHEGYTLRGLYNRLDGNPEKALEALDEAVKVANGDPAPFMLRAAVLQDLGRPFEARKTIEDALASSPDSPRLKAMLASIDAKTGNTAVTGVPDQQGQP